ncbi:MAG: lipoyl synthase [Peptococcaceae bacterium]|nr:MAG: lipoyl synthase [Peptococcaceae bacterium]
MGKLFGEPNCDGVRPGEEKPPAEVVSRPAWLRKTVTHSHAVESTREMLADLRLHTVCQGARCPNLSECFTRGTATFMILGDCCTRRCNFCAVAKGRPEPPDPAEPARVAEAAARLGLKYVVITSVTRDDLPDGGAGHFARTVGEVRRAVPGAVVEVLVPDFQGNVSALASVLAAGPDVLNHNVETVPRLYPLVRPRADYRRSLDLLREAGKLDRGVRIKSGLMVGLGEKREEVRAVMSDLRAAGCAVLTVGQYLQPSPAHLPVFEFVLPAVFQEYREQGLALGFKEVASGPWVRSSYRAGEMFAGIS